MSSEVDSKPICQIKPVVVPAQYFILAPLASAFISFFPAFFGFLISNMVLMSRGSPVAAFGIAVFFISFVVCMVLFKIKMFDEPHRTTYAIYPDRIEYDEGLWNRHRRTVVLDQVIDVELTEGVLQQTVGAGTITLVTQQLVSEGDGKLTNRQIALRNVPQPKEVYELIRSLALKKNAP